MLFIMDITTNDKECVSTMTKCSCNDVWDSEMYDNYKNCKKTTHSCNCNSNNIFNPVCKNAVCVVPRMDHATIILKGKGRISNSEPE